VNMSDLSDFSTEQQNCQSVSSWNTTPALNGSAQPACELCKKKKKHNDSIDSASLTNEEGSKEISCARRRFAPCICD